MVNSLLLTEKYKRFLLRGKLKLDVTLASLTSKMSRCKRNIVKPPYLHQTISVNFDYTIKINVPFIDQYLQFVKGQTLNRKAIKHTGTALRIVE